MISDRCPTGTSSASPGPTSSLISASPGSPRLSPAGNDAAPLVSRPLAAPQMLATATTNARACTPSRPPRVVRQPRLCALTAYVAPANLLSRANLEARGGLDFLSVTRIGECLKIRGWLNLCSDRTRLRSSRTPCLAIVRDGSRTTLAVLESSRCRYAQSTWTPDCAFPNLD